MRVCVAILSGWRRPPLTRTRLRLWDRRGGEYDVGTFLCPRTSGALDSCSAVVEDVHRCQSVMATAEGAVSNEEMGGR